MISVSMLAERHKLRCKFKWKMLCHYVSVDSCQLVTTLPPSPPNTADYKYGLGELLQAPGQDFHVTHAGADWHPF
jgi:hypothetical protein